MTLEPSSGCGSIIPSISSKRSLLDGFGFSEKAVNEIIKSLRPYQKRLLEDWYETQSK